MNFGEIVSLMLALVVGARLPAVCFFSEENPIVLNQISYASALR